MEVGNAASRKRSSGEVGEAVTQLRYAREGIVTGEVRYVAGREKMKPLTIREEVARGRMIIPANVNHVSLEPMCIGKAGRVKINANIGNSQTTSEIETEKLRTSVKYGADTVMDLSSEGDIPKIRRAIIEASPVPIGTAPIYEVINRVGAPEEMTGETLPDDYFKTAEFCSMCGPKFCPMHNFRDVDWSSLKRVAEKLPAES
ncbi:MAG TPA: phosphomethylpyrimidine synthase ThiC [Rubrobacteraceae bacterium]|nr:phosphomethylpyrimidine synthase ThiC [Rubrobacteraceae bacterium]